MTDILPAAYRHMDYCAICLQSPARCTCPNKYIPCNETPSQEGSNVTRNVSEAPPNQLGTTLPIDWPERKDLE